MYQEIKQKCKETCCFIYIMAVMICVNVYCGMLVPLFEMSISVSSG